MTSRGKFLGRSIYIFLLSSCVHGCGEGKLRACVRACSCVCLADCHSQQNTFLHFCQGERKREFHSMQIRVASAAASPIQLGGYRVTRTGC